MKTLSPLLLLFIVLISFSPSSSEKVRGTQGLHTTSNQRIRGSSIQLTQSKGVRLLKIGLQYKNTRSNSLAQLKSQINAYSGSGLGVSLIEEKGTEGGDQSITEFRSINDEFIVTLGVGTPSQYINFVMDTGSATLWMTSSQCQDPSCDNAQKFNPNASSTFKKTNKVLRVKFASARVRGDIGIDSIRVGKYSVKGQNFGLIVHEEGSCFRSGVFSGIWGMGFPPLEDTGTKSLFDNIMTQYKLAHNIFSFSVRKGQNKGALIIGGIDHSLYKGKLTYYPVLQQWYWGVAVHDIRVGGVSIGVCSSSSPCYGVLDTGTTELTFPTPAYQKLKTYQSKCTNGELGKLQYVLSDGFIFQFTPAEFFDTQGDCSPIFGRVNIKRAVGMVYLIGAPFFEKYYAVFDRDQNKVGIAQYKE